MNPATRTQTGNAMAKLPLIDRISREDFTDVPKEFEPILDRLLFQINSFFTTTYDALNKNLTLGDNIVGMYKTLRVTAGAAANNNTINFTHTLKVKPTGVTIVAVAQVGSSYTVLTSAVWCNWHLGIDGQINIDAITGLTNTKQYDITFRVE